MAASAEATTVTTGIPGRYILSAGNKHSVVDASAMTGGNAEALVAQELYMAALATCAQAVVYAKGEEFGTAPSRVEVTARSERDPDARPPTYSQITIDFQIDGVDQDVAQRLVDEFTALCPIYYTTLQGAPITVTVNA